MKRNKKVKDEEFAKMQKVYKSNKYVNNGFNFYFSYGLRIVAMFVSIFAIGYVSYTCFNESFSTGDKIKLSYEEDSSVDYDVTLLENNLFEEGTLNVDDNYISDVIDNISTDLNYQYKLSDKVDANYSYYIVATMILKNNNDNSVIAKNEYSLMDVQEKKVTDVDEINILQNINLDYDYYNNLAKQIMNQYSLDVSGNLDIKMYINIDVNYNEFDDKITVERVLDVAIPLLSSNVSVELVDELTSNDEYIVEKNPVLINKWMLYIGILLLILDTIFLLLAISFIFRTTPKKSKYCRLRDGLLRDYDNVIVNSKKRPRVVDYNIIDCYSFSELMDAQRLLGKPIVYYEIVKDQKCVFVIYGDNDVFQFTLKECDVDY